MRMFSAAAARMRHAPFWRRGGIGMRVSLSMTAALVLVALLVGVFFYLDGKKALEAEIKNRALYVAKELAALTMDDIITGNQNEIAQKITFPFSTSEGLRASSALLYLVIYTSTCDLLAGSTDTEVFFNGRSYYYSLPSVNRMPRDQVPLACDPQQTPAPVFQTKQNGVYDLTLSVLSGNKRMGFIRVGISDYQYETKFYGIMKKSIVALLGIILVGIAFSQIIARSITKPVILLSEAADKLSQQNWDTPIPIQGSDEISKLGHAFNEMALTLKNREASLSQGNRDLFILHTAGLDLMEGLDVDALPAKISARAADLVLADTIAIAVLDRSDRMLKYRGVFGNKSRTLQEQEIPIEAGGIYNWIVSYGTPLLIPDAQADFRLDNALMRSIGITSIMTVPLWSANVMTGLITAINKKGGAGFDQHDLRSFTVFSSQAAAALQNSSLYRDLKEKMNELKTAQEQLLHSTKMAAIGELSTNIAHEINNPLTTVLGYTTNLLNTPDLPESPRRILGLMEQETLRVRKIIRNLLNFAHQRPSRMQPGDISQLLRETVALVQGIAGETSVVIHEDYPPAPTLVNMDHNEMKQVVINIVNNAFQAMPQGGDLQIRLDTSADGEVLVEVADTGSGIAPEHLGKIFEPFFSTKDAGNGTGLGLSISYRIVRNHGGRIEAESKPGKGAVFRVFLPSYHKPVMAGHGNGDMRAYGVLPNGTA
jgi:signal transduction histidine kinase/HAMP domain-containing protein